MSISGTSLTPGVYEVDVATDVISAVITCPLDPAVPPYAKDCQTTNTSIRGQQAYSAPVFGKLYISILGEPKWVEIKVRRAGQPIGAHAFSPTYTTANPNGPDCPPTCRVAKSEEHTL